VYVSTELFQRLGIAAEMRAKSRKVDGEPVGAVVARGDAELGFQQSASCARFPVSRSSGTAPRGRAARHRVLGATGARSVNRPEDVR
jgi:molybdate transport system substrate-binding protein